MPTSNHSKQLTTNRPRSIYQYSNMDLSLSGQTSIFNGVFFVFKSLLGIERQNKFKKKIIFDPKALEPCQNIDISNVAKHRVMFVHVTFFWSQVFFSKLVCLLVSRFVLWSRNVHRQQSERSEIFIFSAFYRCPVYR